MIGWRHTPCSRHAPQGGPPSCRALLSRELWLRPTWASFSSFLWSATDTWTPSHFNINTNHNQHLFFAQDFYSHSNWIEIGNTVPFSNLIRLDTPLDNLAGVCVCVRGGTTYIIYVTNYYIWWLIHHKASHSCITWGTLETTNFPLSYSHHLCHHLLMSLTKSFFALPVRHYFKINITQCCFLHPLSFSHLSSNTLRNISFPGPDRATCRNCTGGNCSDNLLPEILQEKKLTSGYFSLLPSAKPPGCHVYVYSLFKDTYQCFRPVI